MHTKSVVKVVLTASLGALLGCGSSATTPRPQARMSVTSSAFSPGGSIPREFTCDGANVRPPLHFAAVPPATALALIVIDPDAGFTHWVVFDLPPGTGALGPLPAGAREGRNSFGAAAYGGPCPPRGAPPHHYVFTLYALSRRVGLPNGAAATEVQASVSRSAIATGQLVGRYGR